MVDILGINATQNQANRVTEKSSARGTSSKTSASSSSSSASTGDRIEISAGAKEASAVRRLVGLAQTEPDVRPEAVAQAKEKLANGEFNGAEVSRETAKKILGL